MIWESVLLMTMIDIALIGVTGYACLVFYKHRQLVERTGIKNHIALILFGLILISLFYFTDLLSMHVLPLFISHKDAMAWMFALHLNWHWLVSLLSVSIIVIGVVLLGRKIFPIYSRLKSNELRFQDIAAGIPGLVFQLQSMPDGSRSFTYVSPNISELLGLNPLDVVHNAGVWFDIIHPDDQAALETSLAESAKETTPWLFEGRMIRQQNDEVMWFRVSSEPKKMDDGSILWNGMVLDITQRKQAKNMALRMDRLMRQSVNEIYVFDARTLKFLQISQGALDNLGYNKAELQSLTPLDLKKDFTRESFEAMLQPLRDGKINQLIFETLHTRKDGTSYAAEIKLQYAGDESPPVFMSVIQDVTEREETIETLHQSRDQLEQRVQQRTHELAKSEARQRAAKQEAEEANKAKSEFLSRMSHELRTPLNAIFGFSQLLQSNEAEPLTPTQQHDLEEIIRASKKLLDLVNKLLDLSLIESGHLNVDIQIINVVELVNGCIAQVEPNQGQARQITIRNRITDTRLHLLSDPGCFRQIMANLLSNAIKYNEDGGSVIIDCKPAKHKDWLRIQVSDTGAGISKDQVSKLFDPFEQFTTKNSITDGTGIGLSVARHLVEAMDGTIGVDSVPGQGSTFWFELPTSEGTARESDPSTQDKPELPLSAHYKLLYIEDNPANLEMVRDLLVRYKNITVLTARTAEMGLEIAETQLPDLILMDMGLPGIDGFQAMEILQTVEATRNIPVVAISANALPADIKKALSVGFRNYLTKPLNLEQLTNTIEQVLAT